MVGVVYHEEKGRAWAGSLALRFLLHFTENALHGSGLHGTIVLLSSCHSTRENSYLLVDACDPRRSTYHGKVNTARSKQACQDVETHFFFLEHKIRRQTPDTAAVLLNLLEAAEVDDHGFFFDEWWQLAAGDSVDVDGRR